MLFRSVVLAAVAVGWALPCAAAGDAEAGKAVFRKCMQCHTAEAGKNRIGPSLFGIVGRKSATVDGFNYSPAMKAYDKTWTVEVLEPYLAAPQKIVPGSRMVFPGLPSAKEREDVIAYLQTLK